MPDPVLTRLLSGHLAPGAWRLPGQRSLDGVLAEAASRGWFCAALAPCPWSKQGLIDAIGREVVMPDGFGHDLKAVYDAVCKGPWMSGGRVLFVVHAPPDTAPLAPPGEHDDADSVAEALNSLMTDAADELARRGVALYLLWLGGSHGADLAYWSGLDHP